VSALLQAFDFESNAVRVVVRDAVPWFVATDVCRLLGLNNATQAIDGNLQAGALGLEDDEKGVYNLESHSAALDGSPRGRGGAQSLRIVNESGLYALIFKSRKAEARRFRKWVTAEVLPAIRRDGEYRAEQARANSERGQLARLRRLLLETAEGVKAGALTPGKAQAIAIASQRYLETLKVEAEAIGYETVLGLSAGKTGGGVLPLGHAGAELLQGVPQSPLPRAEADESSLPAAAIPGEETLGGAPSAPGEGALPDEPEADEEGVS